jgi:antitoxin FitA
MPNVLVRDLPAEVHARLQRRAEEAGQSLQQFLAAELTRLAATPSMKEVLARIAQRQGGRIGVSAAVHDLEEERDRR